MKLKKFVEMVKKVETAEDYQPDADVKMHGRDGNPLLFILGYANDPNVVVLEDASDNDLRAELCARFENAAETQMDELDFFIDLLETGFTIDDIEKFVPEHYVYAKEFMETHGLI